MTQTPAPIDTSDLVHIELGVTGMTCTSCSSRIERKINKVEGADAIVNYATETATIDYDPSKVTEDELIEVVRGAGYDAFTMTAAQEPATAEAGSETGEPMDRHEEARLAEEKDLRGRLIWSAIFSVPVVALSMIPTASALRSRTQAKNSCTLSSATLRGMRARVVLRHSHSSVETISRARRAFSRAAPSE